MKTGRPPKPTALKKLQGTLQPCRENRAEWKPPQGAPTKPAGLDPIASAEWDAVLPQLVTPGIATVVDGRVVEAYCIMVSRARQADEVVRQLGLVVQSEQGPKANPAVAISKHAWAEAHKYGATLGLDPSARARTHVDGGEGQADEAADFLFAGAPQLKAVPGGKE